jgi:hypothetical protein
MRIHAILAALVAGVSLLGSPLDLWAQAGVQVEPRDTVRELLTRQQGKPVVHLSGLTGREFFDAVVYLERVQAVILRAR